VNDLGNTAAKASAIAELEACVGKAQEFKGVDEVSINDIRRKLEVYCFDCPLHYDPAVARAHGYRGVVSPVALTPLWALPAYWNPGEPVYFIPSRRPVSGGMKAELPNKFPKGLNVGSRWEYFEPLYHGDRLAGDWRLTEVKPRETRLGDGVFLTYETNVYKQSGELVGKNSNTSFSYFPHAAEGKKSRGDRPKADGPTTEGMTVTPADPLDWTRQLKFGDVAVGDAVPTFAMWFSYQRIVMSVAVDRMFSASHHNRELARAGGLTDIILNTRSYEMLFEVMLRRWIGLAGRIRALGPFKMGGSTHPDDVLSAGATVTEKSEANGENRVTVELVAINNRGEAARGQAQISLPA
jgi:3-methylfumaryl-CoA hydratase